jgi:hypothetical protein
VPDPLKLNNDTVVDGEYTGKPFTDSRKENISKRMTGKRRSEAAKKILQEASPTAVKVK